MRAQVIHNKYSSNIEYHHLFRGALILFFNRLQLNTSKSITISLVYSPHHDRLVAFRNIFKVFQHHTIIKIPYLDQDADYVDQFGREFSGAELVHSSIHIPFAASDFQSYTLELSRT
ncbi:hypothetical protein [Streptococcus suis]|uniref:Glycosyl hydrolase family 36 C-terminal domain-containing protein n=1 Tax=Streptococcus suis TaxID=1307 RepID=A0A540UXG5_STRSU|nr:hypothetical protein [Streptococcus suis]NQH23191.1 hypothetical protein [Streptococcus suis]NQH54296.1 hypothetical protein [Streptococcus suis]NQH64157.1 hypothetical protein [Streptococcus suis]NQN37482.1 hypothetical protein [Streptococcus suis]NQP21382.1 hypothetical protein [Streptococcus suis]